MLCRGRNSIKCKTRGSIPVYLNVYDLTSMNEYAYWFGLGVYHSGVQGQISDLELALVDFLMKFVYQHKDYVN